MRTYHEMRPIQKEELLTVKEVADQLRVDPTTVRRWIKNGSLEAISFPEKIVGRQRQTHRIRRSVLEALLKAPRPD
ncbi:MAG TPA: helix-turn-helix domain-containing protein [Ktedonosporobacter sp.]|nr:helix-turn-helix domain-containing protein [Ktedonosporobacter sp.]